MPAPKGNKFYLNAEDIGCNKIWESPEELQKQIDIYFDKCDANTKQEIFKDGILNLEDPIPYTIEGLCEVLDCDRKTLLNYQKKEGYEDFFHTIKKAKRKILKNKIERGLMGKSPSSFAIFDLINNSDYENINKTDITTLGKEITNKVTKIEIIRTNGRAESND